MQSKTPLRETQDYLAEILGTSAQCHGCGFRYREYKGHIIPCPVCALGRRDALLRLAAEKIMCYQAEYGLKYVGGAVDLPARIESELKG